jgi:branched-chain amino acid transport system substrate-binding protein
MLTRKTVASSALLPFIAVASFLLGCGSSVSVKDEPKKIRLGILVESSDSSDTQKQIGSAMIAVRQINEQGGLTLNGTDYELDLVPADHGADPKVAVAAVQQFAKDGITAFIGPPWSSLALGTTPDFSDGAVMAGKTNDLLMISHSASAPALTTIEDDGLFFRTLPSDSLQAKLSAERLTALGISTAAVLYRDDAYGEGLNDAFREAFSSLGGEITASAPYPATGNGTISTYGFDDELDLVFAEKPEAVLLFSFDEVFQISTRIVVRGDLKGYGKTPPLFWGVDGFFAQDLLENGAPEVISHMSGTSPWVDEEDPNYQVFKEWVIASELDVTDNTAAPLYDATFLMALAMQKAHSMSAAEAKLELEGISKADPGDVTIAPGQWEEAKQALLAGKDINYDGASGPIEFNAKGDPSVANYVVWKIKSAEAGYEFDLSDTVTFEE